MELIHSICECLSLQLVPSAPSALSLWEPAWQIRIAGPLLALHTNYGSPYHQKNVFNKQFSNSPTSWYQQQQPDEDCHKVGTLLAPGLQACHVHRNAPGVKTLISSWRRSHCWSPSSPSSLPPPSTRSTPSRRNHCQQDEPSPGPITPLTGSPTRWGTTWTNDGTVSSDDNRRYNEWKCCDYGDDIIMFSPWRCQSWVVSSP